MMKKILLFIISFLITLVAVVGYFKVTQKLSSINLPTLPSLSFSDIVRFSRFSLEKAPSQSLVGVITSMEGEVMHEERLATTSAKINIPIPIQQGESLSTGIDGRIILIFEKAAEIIISAETTVNVIQTLPANLVFYQTKGSATYIKLADIPVSIRTRRLLIENYGDITVTLDKVEPVITIAVNSGSATFAYNNLDNVSQVLLVNEGKTLTFNESTRQVVQEY
jgi:hypothetical protein